MHWTEFLPAEGRKVVETCLNADPKQGWWQRLHTVEQSFANGIATGDERQIVSQEARAASAHFITGAVVAAIIEQLDSPEIVEADQAQFFAMSASPDHQAAACDWFIQQIEREPEYNTAA